MPWAETDAAAEPESVTRQANVTPSMAVVAELPVPRRRAGAGASATRDKVARLSKRNNGVRRAFGVGHWTGANASLTCSSRIHQGQTLNLPDSTL